MNEMNRIACFHSLHFASFIIGRFYKLALTDCETIFEVNLFVSEGV